MKKKENNILWWKSGLALFSRVSSWIIGPIFFAVFLGRFLDKRYDIEPWIFLSIVGFAIVIAFFGIFRETKREMKKNNRNTKDKL